MKARRVRVSMSLLIVLIMATVVWLNAGDLNPPVGPVAPTHKTLTEVEPRVAINATNTPGDADSLFKITQRGSYYLTGNISGVTAKHGIEITASGVTLDLNGFDLLGGFGTLDGVTVTVSDITNIAVVNGSVRSWGNEGIDLSLVAFSCRVCDVLASNNSNSGILAGDWCTISRCSAIGNSGTGILVGVGCKISECVANGNEANGISLGNGCTVFDCTARNNQSNGISVSAGCIVTNCSAGLNSENGILCTSQCLIRGNSCTSNGLAGSGFGAGIRALDTDNRIEDNNCKSGSRGIAVDNGNNFIIKNSCGTNVVNWEFAADNVFGPILDRINPGSPAVSGSSAPSSLSSTAANANFTY